MAGPGRPKTRYDKAGEKVVVKSLYIEVDKDIHEALFEIRAEQRTTIRALLEPIIKKFIEEYQESIVGE